MSVSIVKKIGILINWTREIDMYNNFISNFNKKDLVYIINDSKTFESERKNNVKNIIKGLKKRRIKYEFFSENYKKKKFQFLFSTALFNPRKITFFSIFKYFYGKTIGSILIFFRFNLLFKNIFNREFTAGGINSKIYTDWYPERELGLKTVFFPRGFDLRLNYFPDIKFKKIFDIFLCYGLLDYKLIKKKFKNKKSLIIGYPRYDKKNSLKKIKKKVFSEFNINNKKKLIFWCPTHIEEKDEMYKNILLWQNIISNLTDKYNILVRPHPKSIAMNVKIVKDLKKLGFKVDQKIDRIMQELYQVSDIVLADYGGSVLSSIYLNKALILLNLPNKLKYVKRLSDTGALDYKLRNNVESLDVNNVNKLNIHKKISYFLANNNVRNIKKIREKYFGNMKKKDKQIKNFINQINKEIIN